MQRFDVEAGVAAMFADVRSFTALYNDITPTVSKYWEGPGKPRLPEHMLH